FEASGGTYGSPRITHDLHQAGWRVSKNTVAMRMAELGLAGRPPKKRRSLTRQGRRPAAPDLVRRKFTAIAPDVLWCGDVTEIDTGEGKLYLATVEDLFSRRLLGYAMSEHHDAALTVASLQMAVATRGGDVDGVVFHSDRAVSTPRLATRPNASDMGWSSRWAGSAARSTTLRLKRSTAPSRSSTCTGSASVRGPRHG
ncbi:DDE-type integrase/transposase/recombinase, partial [Microtetraspora niveoalba]|uniref:DDE-type integrase/transposase/recombinase n=1 Tax=Microtetraspora niveoalba TaxID=46175 RepID=UPI000B276FB5